MGKVDHLAVNGDGYVSVFFNHVISLDIFAVGAGDHDDGVHLLYET